MLMDGHPVPARVWDPASSPSVLGLPGAGSTGSARLTPRFCRGFVMPDEGQHQLPGPVATSRSENLLYFLPAKLPVLVRVRLVPKLDLTLILISTSVRF